MGEKGGGYAGRYGSEPRGVEMRGGRTLANEPKRGSYLKKNEPGESLRAAENSAHTQALHGNVRLIE
jgi:hypothetical protein